ncbi:MAG: hypothetical protein ABWY71_00410 [Candidatus Saccharimonadales bacterium]
MLKYKNIQQLFKRLKGFSAPLILGVATAVGVVLAPVAVSAATYYCGSGTEKVQTSIDMGCIGSKCVERSAPAFCGSNHSGVIDMLFAIIRFLSAGVGLVVIASMVFAGIQYTTSRGDPQASAAAIKRIRNTVVALGIYIFAYAILNYLIPAGFFV